MHIEELETREDIQIEMMRLWQKAKGRERKMREKVEDSDHQLVESLDEREQHMRQ